MNNLELYRFIQKIGEGVPTVPPSEDHSTGGWSPNDIYEGELYLDSDTNKLYTRYGSTIIEIGGGTLSDTQIGTLDNGEITSDYQKNIFIYKGTTDGNYDLPIASANKGIEIFIVNKSDYNLTVNGDIWDAGEETSKIVSSSFTYYLISDGEHWVKF